MEKKNCIVCHEEKDQSLFVLRNKALGQYRSHCLDCNRKRLKKNYENNKDYYVEKAAVNNSAYRKRNQVIVDEELAGKECVSCGTDDDLSFFQGAKNDSQPVYMAVASGASKEKVREAIGRSQAMCQTCISATFAGFFADWGKSSSKERKELQLARKKAGIVPTPKDFYRRYKSSETSIAAGS